MGVDRNTNNTINATATDDNTYLQQQQQQQQQQQITKTSIIPTKMDSDNDQNNNSLVIDDSETSPNPSSIDSTPTEDSSQTPSESPINQQEDTKIRSKSPNYGHISAVTGKAKHLKLNTARALQQQQQQEQTIHHHHNHQHHQQQHHNIVPISRSKHHQHQHQHSNHTLNSHEYLAQLLKDKRLLLSTPSSFTHVHRVLDNEINRVRITVLHQTSDDGKLILPEAEGEVVILTKKLFVPQRDYPDFNFVGRILGPRGMTAKQLEQETGCKIMIRGRGSMRDKAKEETFKGKPNWEHLEEDLHVLISVEDTENRASLKLERSVRDVQKLLVPSAEGEDSLKKLQLMELAIINGTYRDLGRSHMHGQMAQIIPMTTSMSGQVCVPGSPLIGLPSHQPPPTPTLVTTPVLLTPRIAPFFPPPGMLTRTSMVNHGQQNTGYSMDLQQYDRQQQMNSGLVFQIDPNYIALHQSPFLEFAIFGGNNHNRTHPQPTQELEDGTLN